MDETLFDGHDELYQLQSLGKIVQVRKCTVFFFVGHAPSP